MTSEDTLKIESHDEDGFTHYVFTSTMWICSDCGCPCRDKMQAAWHCQPQFMVDTAGASE